MADFFVHTISNQFRVKDPAAFFAWCESRELTVDEQKDEETGDRYFILTARDNGTWPDADYDEEIEIDFRAELASHLHPGDVAVLLEIGNEPSRYIGGVATAIHPDGRVVRVALQDIYGLAAATFGSGMNINEALY